MPRDSALTQEMMEVAKRIAGGERYAPIFINEHVSQNSTAYITTNGQRGDKTKKEDYIKGETIVTQVADVGGGSSFIYYDHLAGTTDPFGYTKGYEVGKPDAYFDFDTRQLIVDGVVQQTQNNVNNTSNRPYVDFDYDNKVATVDGDRYVVDDTQPIIVSMSQEYQNNIKKTNVSLTDNLEYAEYSKIHSDSAILYTNNNSNKKNITICVNAGHGTNGGESVKTQCHPDGSPKVTGGSTEEGSTTATAVASGMTFLDGTPEKEATLRMALILRDLLLSEGYNVLMIREEDNVQRDNIARTVLANNYADCHIALHWDDSESDKGAYYMKVPNVDSYKSMEPVASTWQKSDALGEALIAGLRSENIKVFEDGSIEMDLTQTSYSKVPSIDIELGDKASDTSRDTLERMAEGLSKGLLEYYKQNNITLQSVGESINNVNQNDIDRD